jgi:para-nitrobenzyl esterase
MMTVDVSVLMRAVGLALLARVGESASCVVALPGSRGLEVQGVCSDGVASFKGIPYAAAPIGTLRWVPPQDATVAGTIDATSFKPGCNVAEDCL